MSDLAVTSASILSEPAQKAWLFVAITVVFAALGRAIRGVTTAGALAGAAVSFAILLGAGLPGFATLVALFVLTWASTRIGYTRKQRLGIAEAHVGRDERQVLANLGVAAICTLLYAFAGHEQWLLVAVGAALAEAAADTVSSEIGQALGGTPRLIINWREVPAGTDGGITVAGTMAGSFGAIVVALVGAGTGLFGWRFFLLCTVAGIAGMLFDSLLGATLERRNVLGNNGVNFISTAVAAVLAIWLSQVSEKCMRVIR
jgi:uncharacterized protein (TIGR00297 family)